MKPVTTMSPKANVIIIALATVIVLCESVVGESLQSRVDAAREGETITLPPGRYAGPILIDRTINLVAQAPGVVIEGSGDGDVVTITAPDVTIRGLVIRKTGINLEKENAAITIAASNVRVEDNRIEDALFGIILHDARGAIIRNNDIGGKLDLFIARRGDGIKLWNSSRSVIEGNYVHDCRDLVMWYSQELSVCRNRVERCRYGIHFMFAGDAVVEENVLQNNSVGMFLMYGKNLGLRSNVLAHNRGPSGFGLGLKDVDGVDAQDNLLTDNRVALHVDNSPSQLDLTHTYRKNVFAYNDIAIGLMPSVHGNRFVENSFIDNVEQVGVFGGGNLRENSFTVDGKGNYWSDYRGYDADGDGVGDIPHRSQSLFENLMDREPKLRFFLFSPAQQAVELAARAFPIVKPQLRAEDSAPLMRPVPARAASIDLSSTDRGWSGAGLLAAAFLLGVGAIVFSVARREM